MSDVFISYARATVAEASRVGDALASLGYDVWRDDQLSTTRAYSDEIEAKLEAAKAVVVLWSADAVKSQWVRAEADRARAANKLVQVNLDGARLPMPFDQIHCADIRGWLGAPEAPGWRQTLSSVAHLVDPERVAPTSLIGLGVAGTPFSASGDKPSIAALPFANLSNDPEQDYFVDGLMEEIVTALTRIRTLFVIDAGSSLSLKGQDVSPTEAAQKLGVRYVLEGSVRKAGQRVRIAVKLVDGYVGNQIWAERFDGQLDDIFSLQDDVAGAIAGVTEFSVQNAEAFRALTRPTSDLRSWDLYLRALVHFRTYQREEMYTAIGLLERAVAFDPNYALALSLLAGAHAVIVQWQWTDDPAAHGAKVGEYMARSLHVGADDPQVVGTAAFGYWFTGDFPAAARLAERAVNLNPGSSFTLLARGVVSASMGELDIAEDCVLESMKLDPLSPNRSIQLGGLATIRFARERFDEAAEVAGEWMAIANHPMSAGLLASAGGHLHDAAIARQGLSHLQGISTMPRPAIAAMLYHRPEHTALFLKGLALADGLAAV